MRIPFKTIAVLTVAAGTIAASYGPAEKYWKEKHRTQYQEEDVIKGKIIYEVNSTGTVQPVLSIHIGAYASGPITELHVEFNQQVKKDDLLAKIDQGVYEAMVERDKATLATKLADVERVKALLQQANNDLQRAESLRATNKDYVSDTEMDQFRFNQKSLTAQLGVSEASVKEAKANLKNSETNLGYTLIKAPCDGIVIDRKIDPGQTVASQFQTPELFIIAPDIKKEMYVMASVDEADIGLLRQAREAKSPVHFTVDAYPDDLFQGRIKEIRMNSTTTQNVVTYPVVVSAPNPEMKLLPGMTANISFEINQKTDVAKIPNAALRFYPKPEQVRPEDKELLEGLAPKTDNDEPNNQPVPSAREKAAANRTRNRRHVWVQDGDFLRAVAVTTGISDSKHTELVSGDLPVGSKVVTGIRTKP